MPDITPAATGPRFTSRGVRADGRRVAVWTGKNRANRVELTIDGAPYVLEATRIERFRLWVSMTIWRRGQMTMAS